MLYSLEKLRAKAACVQWRPIIFRTFSMEFFESKKQMLEERADCTCSGQSKTMIVKGHCGEMDWDISSHLRSQRVNVIVFGGYAM